MSMYGILQIAYYFPPIKTVGTLRNARFCQTAARYWSHISVITTAHVFVFDQETMPFATPQIHRISSFDFRWLIWNFSGKKATYFSPQLKKKPGIGWLRRVIDSFPLNILFADGGLSYILLGYWRGCAIIKQGHTSHIFSSFRPMSDHFLAFLLVWRFPQLVWIADFRDILVDPLQRNVLFPGMQHRILRYLLRRASLLTTVSEGLMQHLQQHYERPVEVLYNAPLAEQALVKSTGLFNKFTMVYTGALYPGLQSAEPLFMALQHLVQTGVFLVTQIRIVVCGKDGALWREWAKACQLDDILEDRGVIPHQEALALQHKAQINLMLSWNSHALQGIITSKLFEYLQAQKPILALVNGDTESELENLIHTYAPSSLVVYLHQEPIALVQFLQKEYQNWQKNQTPLPSLQKPPDWEGEMEKLFKKMGTEMKDER